MKIGPNTVGDARISSHMRRCVFSSGSGMSASVNPADRTYASSDSNVSSWRRAPAAASSGACGDRGQVEDEPVPFRLRPC